VTSCLTTPDIERFDHALETFMIWLQGVSAQAQPQDQLITAAEQLCQNLKAQIALNLAVDDATETEPADTELAETEHTDPTQSNQDDHSLPATAMSVEETPMDMSSVADYSNVPQQNAGAADTLLIPIGIWLGFHDEDSSVMVKLAVYDRANDNYIFANKQGFLARQMNTPDLLHLIENELVDIIERRVVPRIPKT
jgi:hypothetical protein